MCADPACASDWWFVSTSGNSPNRRVILMDTESAASEGGNRIKVWSYEIYERLGDDGRRKEKVLDRYDCGKRTITLLSYNIYGNNDRFIDSGTIPPYSQSANEVVPDTVGESQWKFVCKNSSSSSFKIDSTPEEFAAKFFKEF
jgi:hypothetical protein